MDDEQLTIAIALALADRGVGSWRPDGDFTPGETGIYYGALDESPDRAVGVTVYAPVVDDVETGLTARRAQLRCRGVRGSKVDADVLAGEVFVVLHKLSRQRGIAFARRESFALLGADANGRQERTENYTFTIDNPEA